MSEKTVEMSFKKIRVEDLDQLQHAEYAMRSLKKAVGYLTFFNRLESGMEVSKNMILDLERMMRALSHRVHVLKKVA